MPAFSVRKRWASQTTNSKLLNFYHIKTFIWFLLVKIWRFARKNFEKSYFFSSLLLKSLIKL